VKLYVRRILLLLQDYLPLVTILCNSGMRARHWVKMSEIVGFDITPDAGTTLRKMLKLNLYPFLPQFEEVSAGATKVTALTVDISVHFVSLS